MIYLGRESDKMFSITDFDEMCDYAHMWNWAPDWHMVKQIYTAFPDSYSILTPFAYTYLEELIRSTTSEYGIPLLDREGKKNNIKVGLKLVNLAIKKIQRIRSMLNYLKNLKNILNMIIMILMKEMAVIRYNTVIYTQGFGARKILKS